MRQFMIIGGGARGLYFTEILEKELQSKVVAIVETHTPGLAFVHQRLTSANITGVEVLQDMEEAFRKYPATAIDGVFIMTPEWTHAALFRAVTQHHYHVFLEKPIATSQDDAKSIRQIAADYPQVIQLGFVLRYSGFYRQVKSWLAEPSLGRIVMIQMNERLTVQHGMKFKRSWHRLVKYTGGYINEKCSHDLDLMCWFMEDQAHPVRVVSMGQRGFATQSVGQTHCATCDRKDCLYRDDPTSYDKYVDGQVLLDSTASVGACIYGNDSDIHDHQTVLVQFSDGSHGVFSSVAMSGIPGRDLTIHLEYGVIYGNLEEGTLHKIDYRTHQTEDFAISGMNMHGGGDTQVVREFVECIENGTQPLAKVSDGVRATLLALTADESVRLNQMVEFDT